MKYDVDYFIKKFSAIPEEYWTIGQYVRYDHMGEKEKCCALGHCGMTKNQEDLPKEAEALYNLFLYNFDESAAFINDGRYPYSELGYTPKERILNALVLVKAGVNVNE